MDLVGTSVSHATLKGINPDPFFIIYIKRNFFINYKYQKIFCYCMSEYDDRPLDKARQEIESIGKQISDLSPLAISLSEKDNSQKDIVNNILTINDRIEWNDEFQELIKRLLVAQSRYIQLLEKSITK
jgi:hypothetical protein